MMESVGLAAFGGLAVNVLNLLELQNIPASQRPDLRSVIYWLPYLFWPVVGGVLGYAYRQSGADLNPVLAINVGVSAPLVIRAMAAAAPFRSGRIDPGAGA